MKVHASQRNKLRAPRVIVMEDNADGRESLRTLLQLWGYRVEVAADGATGLEKARVFRPHIALVDIGLPGMDGYHVARQLRNAFGDASLLIAQTAYSGAEDRERGRAAGFDAWLVKPLNPEELCYWLLVGAARALAG